MIFVFIALMIGFVLGIKATEYRFSEQIYDMVDLMRIDGVIKW
jgi:hypothetical protein